MNTINSIIDELKKFSGDLVQFGQPINDNRIEIFEEKYNLNFPEEFKQFMKITNGITVSGDMLNRFSDEKHFFSIEYSYEQMKAFLPTNFVPIAPDGSGNYYCLDLSTRISNLCPIMFWQANYPYDENDLPDMESDSFLSFIQERFINITLENYHYNGKRK